MRRIAIASLLGLTLLLAACGGGDDEEASTEASTEPSNQPVESSTTTAAGAPAEDGPGCKALKGYQNADLIALRVASEGTLEANRDQVVTGLDNTQARIDEIFPQFSDEVAAIRARTQVIMDGGEPTPEQQAAAEEATKGINQYKAANCAPPPAGSAQNLPAEVGPEAAGQAGGEPAPPTPAAP